MPWAIRFALIALSVGFISVGGYYRIQSQRSGERLDRTQESWPILIGIRLTGLLAVGCTAAWLFKPGWFQWAYWPISTWLRWVGVAAFGFWIAWLLWMFHTLGRNLTDTVVTRREAYFVEHGPYRFVRNPMYTSVLMASLSLGLALGTWIVPLAGSAVFAMFAVRTRVEEKYLITRFGERYAGYMKRVGRFFPKVQR